MEKENNNILSFDKHIAKKYSIAEAIILQDIMFWCGVNSSSQKETVFFDGSYWMYKSLGRFTEELECFSFNTIRRAIKKLEDNNIITSRTDLNNSRTTVKYYTVLDEKIVKDYNELWNNDFVAHTIDTDIPLEDAETHQEALEDDSDTQTKPKPIKKRREPKTRVSQFTDENGIGETDFIKFFEKHTEDIDTPEIHQKKVALSKLYDDDEMGRDQYHEVTSISKIYESMVTRKGGYARFRDIAPYTIRDHITEYMDREIHSRTQYNKRMA